MWKLYDAIARDADCEDRIEYARAGSSWAMVKLESGALGVAAVQKGRSGMLADTAAFSGMPLRQAAMLVRSWDFECAAVALAAVNAHLNRAARFADCGEADAFLRYRERVRGKRVAVIGRFQYLEERLRPICDLAVLERSPQGDEYPDPACEYVLADADLAFVTGCTVSNKTLTRLLALTERAYTVITGPSTPMTPSLFGFGADALCGFCVTDEAACLEAVAGVRGLITCGRMVCLEKEHLR